MTSVERIKEYAEIKPEETNLPQNKLRDWPVEGKICYENVSFRHHENLPYVLNNLNFVIKAGEKVNPFIIIWNGT